MTNDEWGTVLRILYGCWPRMDQTAVIAQAWRLTFDRYPAQQVKTAILLHYTKSQERFGPMPNDILKVVKKLRRQDSFSKMIEKARNEKPRQVKCLPIELEKSRMDIRDLPEAKQPQEPTRDQLIEARRIKAALRSETNG